MTNLTPAQRSIFYEQELTGINANIGGYLRIPCHIDPDLFAAAFRILVDTNDALRLSFQVENDIPQQSFNSSAPGTLCYVDLSAENDPEAAAEDWMQARFAAPFPDYTSGLFDGALVKARDDLYFYHAKGNHLVIDGLSYALMCQRLLQAYKGLRNGDREPIETGYPSALSFFAEEEDYLSTARYQKDRAYWLEQHAGSCRPLFEDLRQPTGLAATATKRTSLCIDAATYARIEELGRANEAGTAAVFIGALYAYFSRLFNRQDIVLGLPVHNRRTAKLRQTLGPLVNVNAAKLCYDDKLEFADLVRKIASDRRRDYRHQRYPVNHLGRELGVYGDGRRRPFDIGFSFEPSDFNLELDGIPIPAFHRSNGVQQVPLNFTLCQYDKAQDIWLHLDYQTSVVDKAEATRHLERLECLLQALLRTPSLALWKHSILSQRDREGLLAEQQRSPQRFEDALCVHEWFERQANLWPTHQAISQADGSSLSYDELNQAANRLAHCLLESGIRSGARVGIYLNRSVEMMIATLGILKSGAVYVPVDKQWPVDRCRFILADAGVELVLTTSSLMEVCPLEGVDFLLLDTWTTNNPWMREYSNHNIPTQVSGAGPQEPAYVLYTSGSTGRPKGAVIEHQSFVNYLSHSVRHYMRPDIEGSVVSSPLSFDATITTLFAPLLAGCRVTLLPESDNATVLSQLSSALFDRRASQLFKLTPAHLDALAAQAEQAGQANVDSRHVIVIGGEQLGADTLAPWRARLLPCSTFINEYGPTETVVGCSVYEVTPGCPLQQNPGGVIPIGQAIQNTQLYVVNPTAPTVCESALQPSGAIGELYIGGVGLAREYLNRPELTTQRFVADPFSEVSGARLYRTGDLVRRRSDGNLEFVGRTDDQLKLRGYRIEPGELETRLREVPLVQEAVVVGRLDADGETCLVAYVVPKHTEAFDETALVAECRSHLQQHLPDYMVPAAVVCLRELPLTTNGKVDRKQLPAPDGEHFRHAADVAPRTEQEAQLCQLWSEILGVERVGPHDNFFNLGGHSLKATRLVSLMRDRLNIEVPLQAVFEQPTVARLTNALSKLHSAPVLHGISEVSVTPFSEVNEYEEGEL